jgi:hypothetical protein
MTPSLVNPPRSIHLNAPATPASRSLRLPTSAEPRLSLQQQIVHHENQARAAAVEGRIDDAARLILQALQCERRLFNTGPQVLQLIKPRH